MTELDDPEALADAKIVADAFGIHYEPFKQGLIARARRERLQRILLRLLPIVAVCGGIVWFGFAAWKNSKIHVIDMSGAQVSIAELPDSTSVEAGKSWCRLTTEEAAIVDLGEMPSANGVITADLVLGDAAKCGIVIRRFETEGEESYLAVTVSRSASLESPEINANLSVYSISSLEGKTHTFVKRALHDAPAGALVDGEVLSIKISLVDSVVSVSLRNEFRFARDIETITRHLQPKNASGRLGIFARRGSPEVRRFSFQTP